MQPGILLSAQENLATQNIDFQAITLNKIGRIGAQTRMNVSRSNYVLSPSPAYLIFPVGFTPIKILSRIYSDKFVYICIKHDPAITSLVLFLREQPTFSYKIYTNVFVGG